VSLFADRYELLERLGEGGTAVVWQALDHKLGAHRALKMLSAGAGVGKARHRLQAEAKAMAQLHHKHVLRVYDIGYAGGRDFVVMDMAMGSLHERMVSEGPLPPDEVVRLCVQVLSALEAAHAAGIVHRDVKPQNILLDSDGDALLADFGIALIEQERFRNTRTGVAMGSLGFMAPEQRLDARSVDLRADVYAMGCTLFNLLTGKTPIDLFTVNADHERYADVPEELRPAIFRATRHDPSERFASAWEMSAELLARTGLHVPVPTRSERPWVGTPAPTVETMVPEDFEGSEHTLLPPVYTPTREVGPVRDVVPVVHPAVVAGKPSPPPELAVAVLVAVLLLAAGLVWKAMDGSEESLPAADVVTADVALERTEAVVEEAGQAEPELPPAEAEMALAPDPEPELELELEPQPEPTTRPAKVADAPPGPVATESSDARTWKVSFNGRPGTLSLTGPDDALTGTMTVKFLQSSIATQVRGSLDGTRLSLEDIGDEPDLGRYSLTLVDGRVSGSFTRYDGAMTFPVVSVGP
jgi:hypothetical protein